VGGDIKAESAMNDPPAAAEGIGSRRIGGGSHVAWGGVEKARMRTHVLHECSSEALGSAMGHIEQTTFPTYVAALFREGRFLGCDVKFLGHSIRLQHSQMAVLH